MWEKERKFVAGLGKLYPEFLDRYKTPVKYNKYNNEDYWRVFWVLLLCTDHLNLRLPSLEEYIKSIDREDWRDYKTYFGIKE